MTADEIVKKISVYGMGNVLLEDDGVGPQVIEELIAHYVFPANVEIEDLGTPGLDLVPHLSQRDAVIIVDAISGDQPAGTIRVFRRDDIVRHPPPMRMSPHDPGLKESIQLIELEQGGQLSICLVGVVALKTGHGAGLSPPVAAALPHAIETVVAELKALGVEISTQGGEAPFRPWWS